MTNQNVNQKDCKCHPHILNSSPCYWSSWYLCLPMTIFGKTTEKTVDKKENIIKVSVAIVVVSNKTQTHHLNYPAGKLFIFYNFYHIWHLCILFYRYLWILSHDNNISGSHWNTGLGNQLKFLFSSLVIYWDFNFS